jgi:hypothetical protein
MRLNVVKVHTIQREEVNIMVRLDGSKVQEIKDHYKIQAEAEIKKVEEDETVLSDDDREAVLSKWEFKATEEIQRIQKMSPQSLFKNGLALDSTGWREGYTTKPLKKRVAERRKTNKASKQARKQARRK